jgi:hypothetical protein
MNQKKVNEIRLKAAELIERDRGYCLVQAIARVSRFSEEGEKAVLVAIGFPSTLSLYSLREKAFDWNDSRTPEEVITRLREGIA